MKLHNWIWALTLLFPLPVFATSYLCIPEVAASVSDSANGFESSTKTASDKYLLSDTSGKWSLKYFGDDYELMSCESEFLCRTPNGFRRLFSLSKAGIFTYIVDMNDGASSEVFVVKGECAKI